MNWKTFFFIILFLCPSKYFAQDHQLKQIGEFGFGGGAFKYIGDLNPKYNFKCHQPAVSIFYRSNLANEYLILNSSISLGSIKADESKLNDPYLRNRGLKFHANVTEVSLVLEYNFFDYRSEHDLKIKRIHSPYLFGGAAFALLSNGQYESFVTSLIYGVGIKSIISHHWNIGCDIGVRHTYSDEIDGYPNSAIANTSSKNDLYFLNRVYVSYSIFESICRDFSDVWKRK